MQSLMYLPARIHRYWPTGAEPSMSVGKYDITFVSMTADDPYDPVIQTTVLRVCRSTTRESLIP
jgi:hypothetical protein